MALAMNDKTLMEAVGAESGSARLVKQVAMVVLRYYYKHWNHPKF